MLVQAVDRLLCFALQELQHLLASLGRLRMHLDCHRSNCTAKAAHSRELLGLPRGCIFPVFQGGMLGETRVAASFSCKSFRSWLVISSHAFRANISLTSAKGQYLRTRAGQRTKTHDNTGYMFPGNGVDPTWISQWNAM